MVMLVIVFAVMVEPGTPVKTKIPFAQPFPLC